MSQQSDHVPNDVEFILKDIGGSFGKFQIWTYLLLAVPISISESFVLDYVFTSLDLDYRCQIPDCDVGANIEYNPQWLANAVPFGNSKPMRCEQYEPIERIGLNFEFDACSEAAFNKSSVVSCSTGDFVYRTDEVSIVNEFNITCDNSNWKMSMIGICKNVARFVFTPIFGHLSDRYGRLPILVFATFGSSFLKFVSSFAPSYETYLAISFFDAGLSTGTYVTAFILAIEWATASNRVLASNIIMIFCPFGGVFTAFVASQTHNFKLMLRILSVPGMLIIFYAWLAPESLRWLLVSRKYDRTMQTIKKAAKFNGIVPSQRTYDIVAFKCRSYDGRLESKNSDLKSQLKIVFTSRELLARLSICIVGWMVCMFITYGMSVVSVTLSGDKYWNFSVVSLSTIPCAFSSYFLLTYLKRGWTLCALIVASGTTILISYYSAQSPILSLMLFFFGRFLIRNAVMVLYVYTGELWPTNMRHTIMGICSMFGRIGSTFAPMIPLMAQLYQPLPFLLFFGLAVFSGILFLFTPETFGGELPDNVEEAQAIGINRKKCSLPIGS